MEGHHRLSIDSLWEHTKPKYKLMEMSTSSQNLLNQEIYELSQEMCVGGEPTREEVDIRLCRVLSKKVKWRNHRIRKLVLNVELWRTKSDTSDLDKGKRCPEMGISEQTWSREQIAMQSTLYPFLSYWESWCNQGEGGDIILHTQMPRTANFRAEGRCVYWEIPYN